MSHIREVGNPHKPAIIFLHGSPLSGTMWKPQFEELMDEFYCIAPDLPGHGGSASVPFVDSKETAEQIAKIIHEKAPTKRAHVVGLSFGGVIAQAMMVHTPATVDKVVLSGTSVKLSPFLMKIQNLNKPLFKLLKPQQLAKLTAMQFGIPNQFFEGFKEDFQHFSTATFTDMMNAYGEIEMPVNTKSSTLVVVGEKETFVAKNMARKLVQMIPNSVGRMAPAAGHVWNLQYPDLFSKMILSFFKNESLPEELIPL